jgi:hypothetical protein
MWFIFIWLKTGISDRVVWMQLRIFVFREKLGIFFDHLYGQWLFREDATPYIQKLTDIN